MDFWSDLTPNHVKSHQNPCFDVKSPQKSMLWRQITPEIHDLASNHAWDRPQKTLVGAHQMVRETMTDMNDGGVSGGRTLSP